MLWATVGVSMKYAVSTAAEWEITPGSSTYLAPAVGEVPGADTGDRVVLDFAPPDLPDRRASAAAAAGLVQPRARTGRSQDEEIREPDEGDQDDAEQDLPAPAPGEGDRGKHRDAERDQPTA